MRRPLRFLPLALFCLCAHWTSAQVSDSTRLAKRRNGAQVLRADSLGQIALPVPKDSIPLISLANTIPQRLDSQTIADKKSKKVIKDFFKKDYPNPKKALLCSILPGGGQAYNRRWWKLPIIYGGLAGGIWVVNHNTVQYRFYKTNYYNKVNKLPLTDVRLEGYDAASIRSRRDLSRKNLELSGLLLGLGYLLVTAEAFVDAHLQQFDVSDDLSLRVRPNILLGQQMSFGMGLALVF